MRSSTSRYFLPTSSASNRNLNNIFESKRHPNSLVHGYTESINDKNFSFLRYLGYSTIAIGITVITVTIVFLPYIFASLDGTKEIVKSNGDVFKAKSNTLWSQMQSLKRNIYRRSIAADSDSLAILNLLPKGFIPFPFQKFRRIKSFPPSITPYNFKELLTKEMKKLFDEIIIMSKNSTTKNFNYISSSSIKEPKGSIIISSQDDDENFTVDNLLKNYIQKLNETVATEMKKLNEMEILESMKNAFFLAEQEERERQGEEGGGGGGGGGSSDENNTINLFENDGYEKEAKNDSINSSFKIITINPPMGEESVDDRSPSNNSNSFSQNYANFNLENMILNSSKEEKIAESINSSNLKINNTGLDEIENVKQINHKSLKTNFQNLKNKTDTNAIANLIKTMLKQIKSIATTTNLPVNLETSQSEAYTTNSNSAKNSFESTYKNTDKYDSNLFTKEKIIFIESPEDEQKCIGDPGESGNDGYDGIDGLPGLNGLPGMDGEKLIYGDICNC